MKKLIGNIASFLGDFKRWLGDDGFQYMCVVALVVAFFGWVNPLWIAILIGFLTVVIKEAYDICHPDEHVASMHDLFCGLLGNVLGTLIVLLIRM